MGESRDYCARFFRLLAQHQLWNSGRLDAYELEGHHIEVHLREMDYAQERAVAALKKEGFDW